MFILEHICLAEMVVLKCRDHCTVKTQDSLFPPLYTCIIFQPLILKPLLIYVHQLIKVKYCCPEIGLPDLSGLVPPIDTGLEIYMSRSEDPIARY